jgi:hypothetical protein
VHAEVDLPQDEQAPAFTDDLERVGDGADPRTPEVRRFAFLTHMAMIALVSESINRTLIAPRSSKCPQS